MVRRYVAQEIGITPLGSGARAVVFVVVAAAGSLSKHVSEDLRQSAPFSSRPAKRRLVCFHRAGAVSIQSAWNTGCSGFQPVISCSLVADTRCERVSGSSR